MRRTYSILLLFALLVPMTLSGGCAKVTGDPVIVNTERSVNGSFAVVNAFVTFDDAHRATIKAKYPQVHVVAEQIRKDYPAIYREFWSAEATYKTVKTPDSVTTLNGIIAKVEAIAAAARQALTTVQAL